MKNKVLILPVDSTTFQVENYSNEDISLISTIDIDTSFTQSTDYIEYYIFDENENQIFPDSTEKLLTYSIKDNHVILDPKQDLERRSFDEGLYYISYNFYKKRLNSSITSKYYISQISSDRTELKLNSLSISNQDIKSSTDEFIKYRDTQDYFVDFYLNFGDNNLIIANNIKLDVINENEYSVLIKLYEPLPNDLDIKSQCWVVETLSNTQTYKVQFPISIFDPKDFTYIAGPNLNLNIKDESGVSSKEYSYNTLLNSNITSSNSQIQSLIKEKGLKININYGDFSNFIKFSSAKTRLENFYYKVKLIENYTNQISSLNNSITSGTNLTSEFSSSNSVFNLKIDNIIKNFDSYEKFLYNNSGSAFSYPKSTNQPPYNLSPTESEIVKNWLGSSNSNDPYYGGLMLQAYNFDQNNQDYLYWAIPEYLREDPNNTQYTLFIDMIGQHFDNIWIYTKDIANRFNADNRLEYGISKDLISDAIKDFGIKLYSNNFNTKDLYEAFLGITPNGITFPTTGSELINTTISASNDIIPLDDINKRLYKRIYHNIPYLLKTKGTVAGLRALITSYGIPDTILRVNEFGGKNKNKENNWDSEQNVFNYSLELDGNSYFSSSWEPNSNFTSGRPNTIQFRFKTPGIPQNQTSQSLFSIGPSGESLLLLEYTGSGNTSGSYSGSISDPYKEYGTVKFIPNTSTPSISASVYIPIFDNNWWSVMTTQNNLTASLSIANNINNNIGFNEYDEVTGFDPNYYNIQQKIFFPHYSNKSFNSGIYTPFSGSIQEIRYYTSVIDSTSFENFTLNPYFYKGNNFNTTNELCFRADLGTLSYTSSRSSIHPKITGSWVATSSFNSGESSFYLSNENFKPNVELIYQNQTHQGIKNNINNRIFIPENIFPTGDTLSSKRSLQQYSYLTQSQSPDADYLEVAFSPTNQINDDIIAELGNFNIGDYIGDPRHISESRTNYPDLDKLRDQYFLKYIKSYDVKDFIRLIKYFDNSLFKMIKDFTPARTNLSSGVVVKQHILERNAYSPIVVDTEPQIYSGSVKSFPRGYNTGSGNTGTYETIGGSTIEVFKGGTGGVFERFNGLDFHISGSNGGGPNNRFGVTQSWFDVYKTTGSSNQKYMRDDQREFYNGEFSQSTYIKLQRGKDYKDDDPCYYYLNWENVPELLYNLEFFSGSDDAYRIEPFTPPPPITLNTYFVSHPEGNGNLYTPTVPCNTTSSNLIYTNVSNTSNISQGTKFHSDITSLFPWTGSNRWYGIREYNLIPLYLNITSSEYINYIQSPGGFTGSSTSTELKFSNVSTLNTAIGNSGAGAEFNITMSEGEIIAISASATGSFYNVGDILELRSDFLGGSSLKTDPLVAPPAGNALISMAGGIGPTLSPLNLGSYIEDRYVTGSFGPITASLINGGTGLQSGGVIPPTFELKFVATPTTLIAHNPPSSSLYSIKPLSSEGVKALDSFEFSSDEINEFISQSLVNDSTIQPGDPLPCEGFLDYNLSIKKAYLNFTTAKLYLSSSLFISEIEDTQNQLSVKINDNGVVTNVSICQFPRWFHLRKSGGLFTSTQYTYAYYDSNFDVGDKVKVEGDTKCWTIIGILSTITNPLGVTNIITTSCTPDAEDVESINLRYSTNVSLACTATQTTYYINSDSFYTATSIYDSSNGIEANFADSGYYSDGLNRRLWNKDNGFFGDPTSCSTGWNLDLSGLGTGGGNKIICNELHAQGFLDGELWDADERYGDLMFDKDPALVLGYQMWAQYVVKYMRNNPQNTKYLYRVFKPWTEYMGYKMGVIDKQNYLGKLMHNIGKYPTYLIYHLFGGKKLLNYINHKRFLKNIG